MRHFVYLLFLVLTLSSCASNIQIKPSTLEIPKIQADIPEVSLKKDIVGEDSDSYVCFSYDNIKKLAYNNNAILAAYKNIIEKYKLVIEDRNKLADVINQKYS